MANFTLVPHSEKSYPFSFITKINANKNSFYVSYTLEGDISSIDLGNYTPDKNRRLNLWEKSCFELFLCSEDGHYLEFNLAPNFGWNVFSFTKLRGPLLELDTIHDIEMDILNSSEKFFLVAKIDFKDLPEKFREIDKLKFGITSVMKLQNNDVEYWALTHCDQRPNFHRYESFIGKF